MNTLLVENRWRTGWENIADGLGDSRAIQEAEERYLAANGGLKAFFGRRFRLVAPQWWVQAQADAQVRLAEKR